MTDNEIIKALECCSSTSILDCADCPYCGTLISCGVNQMKKDALDLINRQKAEIEELQKYKHDYYVLKAEAIKEFAEIVTRDYPEMEFYLRNLVKEMVGDQNA